MGRPGQRKRVLKVLFDDRDAYLNDIPWSLSNGWPSYYDKDYRLRCRAARLVLSSKLGRQLLPTERTEMIDGNKLNCRRSNVRIRGSK